jgi:hypothetical protein
MPVRNQKRFEIVLPADRRAGLERLAKEVGVSSSDLARIAIGRLLANPDVITGRKDRPQSEAA